MYPIPSHTDSQIQSHSFVRIWEVGIKIFANSRVLGTWAYISRGSFVSRYQRQATFLDDHGSQHILEYIILPQQILQEVQMYVLQFSYLRYRDREGESTESRFRKISANFVT